MPAKTLKFHSGRKVVVKSIRLTNGNLLIPCRMGHDRNIGDWAEVAPGSSEYKRWNPVSVDEADPRETEEYKQWKSGIVVDDDYKKWLEQQ